MLQLSFYLNCFNWVLKKTEIIKGWRLLSKGVGPIERLVYTALSHLVHTV